MTRRSRAPDGGTPGTAAAATRKISYRWGLTHRLATARPCWRTRGRTRTGVAAAKSRTSAGGRRQVAPAANALGRQTGPPVVAGGSSEGICVAGPPVVAESCTVESRVGRPRVLVPGSTTGRRGGPVGGPPGVEGGCAKGARVAGPLVDEAGSTDGGTRRRLQRDNARRRRRVDEHVSRQDRRVRRQVQGSRGEEGRVAGVMPEAGRRL